MMNQMSNLNGAVGKRIGQIATLTLFVLLATLSFGQQLTGTLSGTAYDQSGAVIPKAKVTLKNEASGDVRTTFTDSVGSFAITAVQPASYTITISAEGFSSWEEHSIVMNQGDARAVANIKLKPGGKGSEVTVIEGADAVVPLDTAEISQTLNTQMIQDLPIQGRDAGELLKLMPGMALNNGLSQGSGFNDKVVGTNNGPVGAYSSNGTQPNGAMAFMLDGANLVDPGNLGTQIANINQDMTAEVKVLMSSYSAEYAKGPTIFEAFSKSGGSQFHGEGYLYARNSALNSDDAYAHSQGVPNSAEHYYYIGGNVGGPIPLPFTHYNKNHNKLFFWAGYEYMDQHPAATPINYNVPTNEQRAGDFSNATIDGLPGTTPETVNGNPTTLIAQLQSVWQYAYNGATLPGGGTSLPTGSYDPNVAGILGVMQKPNISPSAANGWNNYQYINSSPQNRWEATGKIDYAINDNTKLAVSYTRQIENDLHPVGVWWTPPWTLPYPSNVAAATTSQEIMANLTHVFSPTTTNEFVFTLARYINPSVLSNPAAVDRTNLGFNVTGLFGHTTSQIPNFEGPWGGAFPNIEEFSFDGSFNGGAFGGLKKDPAIYDNFTKVIGNHVTKFGFYWDTSENVQNAGGLSPGDNGTYNLGWGANSTGNVVADFLLGRAGNYQQVSAFPTNDLKFHQWSLYAQDSFKANKQLTLNYGLRFDHMGQWYGTPEGFQVWNPSTYANGPAGTLGQGPTNAGLLWHALDSKIPLSGMPSPLFYYEPRVGMAYDVFGTGKTVLRAGFAVFRYQISTQVADAANGPEGAFTFTTPNITTGYNQIDSGGTGFVPSSTGGAQNGASIDALQEGDNKTPLTMDWNLTVSQALPWRSVFEISYVANKSINEWIDGNNGKIQDLNNVQPGGFFLPDPIAHVNTSPNPLVCNNGDNNALACANPVAATSYNAGFNGNNYRPLNNYQDIYLLSHGSYANYNSLQVSWQKQSGPITFITNYTFSKVLGIRDGQTDNGGGNGPIVDPFSLKNNYGILAYDHTHILNLGYVWNLPKPIHGNRILAGTVNGWQLSGYTTFQSGAPIQPNTTNLNATYASLTYPTAGAPDLPDNTILLPNGLRSTAVNPSTWFGTSAINNLLPVVTCNPGAHLKSGQSFNPNCFAMPAYGQQGTLEWPYVHGPAYFDSDLALYKNFKVTERQSVQFRVSATNFLNHPLAQFGLAGNTDETLNFQRNYTVPISESALGSAGNECAFLHLSPSTSDPTVCNAPVTGISQTNTNGTTTGKPAFKNGSRFLTFAVKYYF
ncbi:MAG TPA: carboxypeptidase regulatory-like domain-containing protein [Terriglobales bacterium]|nr:carboxypeptidase regulatory-like domain-containing protein [Terriglobales bacterium]